MKPQKHFLFFITALTLALTFFTADTVKAGVLSSGGDDTKVPQLQSKDIFVFSENINKGCLTDEQNTNLELSSEQYFYIVPCEGNIASDTAILQIDWSKTTKTPEDVANIMLVIKCVAIWDPKGTGVNGLYPDADGWNFLEVQELAKNPSYNFLSEFTIQNYGDAYYYVSIDFSDGSRYNSPYFILDHTGTLFEYKEIIEEAETELETIAEEPETEENTETMSAEAKVETEQETKTEDNFVNTGVALTVAAVGLVAVGLLLKKMNLFKK